MRHIFRSELSIRLVGKSSAAWRRDRLLKSEKIMTTFRADNFERGTPVWVWDGAWMPATVSDVMLEPDRAYAIVRFENGGSAPALFVDLEPRDPDGPCTEKPRWSGRLPR
jgi:hypothetical protein